MRLTTPGAIPVWPLRWAQIAGTQDRRSRVPRVRALQYTDEAGEVRGLALYEVAGGDDDFIQHHLNVHYLSTETDEAYAALWRFLLEVDLVTEVRSWMRAVDEPVRWMVRDQRGIKQTVTDHQWVRILDVKAALEARGSSRRDGSSWRSRTNSGSRRALHPRRRGCHGHRHPRRQWHDPRDRAGTVRRVPRRRATHHARARPAQDRAGAVPSVWY